ncbi:hypothetical protein ZTR_01069 [Talaromyces verruculosus]|nr:hypothetical protein ZTR_01069 [Talaromyces verruculosus]
MAIPSATQEMDRLQLSDEDTEELWNSPSQRRTRPVPQRTPASADRLANQDTKPSLDQEEARELALRNELQTVRNVNQAIEGVLESLERARGNMEHRQNTTKDSSSIPSGKAPLTTLPKWKAKQQQNNRLPSDESENSKNVAKRQPEEQNKKRKREQLPQRRRGEVEVQPEGEWYGEEDWGGRRVSLLLKVLLLLVQRERLDQLRPHRRDGRDNGNPINMNFAPYQDESPEVERALSPPPPFSTDPTNRTKSPSQNQYNNNNRQQQQRSTPPPYQASPTSHFYNPSNGGYGYQEAASASWTDPESQQQQHNNRGGYGGARADLDAFETSLPLRVDYEAMLAYLLLPPAGGVFLLLFEHKSDYVRFHAWQSSMLFSAIFVLHLIFSWSSIISWLMFIGDIALIAFLSLHAYQDVDSLDHYEVPIFGRLANSFVDDE